MNLITVLEGLHEEDAKKINIFSRNHAFLLGGSREELLKVLKVDLELCEVLEVTPDNCFGTIITLDTEVELNA